MKNLYKILTVLSVMAVILIACDADVEIDQTVAEIKAEQPTITGFSPGTAAVNSLVDIDGTFLNFSTEAYIGEVEATITSRITGQRLQIQVPNNAVSGVIKVVTEQGKEAVSQQSLTVTYPIPTVTTALPATADVNSIINIIGTDLVGVTGVNFGGTAGTIEFQEEQALVVRVPNNVGFVDVVLTYLTASGEASIVAATNFEVILPQPTIGGFPAVLTRDNEVIVTGQDMNLITDGDVDGTPITINSQSPTEIRFDVPSSVVTGYVDVNLNFQGGGTITESGLPYINGQFEQLYEFDSDPSSVFVVDFSKDPNAVASINGNVAPPPFPGNDYYALEMNTSTSSTVARAKVHQTSTSPTVANILDSGNYGDNPVLHFWMNTENTDMAFKIYIGGTSSSNRRSLQGSNANTGGNWKLHAVRLNGFIPGQTNINNVLELRITPGSSSATVPAYFNFDWFIVTDRVLTEFGAVDVTDDFNPAG
ncbi:IPT/TIG domain-containing protein [Nonlabens arenilitoris]|nr:IPT/TIG domain-containing protein [Nonlabens arenilitoris]